MQKTMGRMLFSYCFPGTFLTSVLIEPVFAIAIPEMLGRLLVRNHPEVQGRQAELALTYFTPMDLSRYSDIVLNMSLAVMVLYLPGGFILPMFIAMTLSHIYIYAFDHWRVLRAVPKFHFSRNTVDRFATTWMALPCALTASSAVFKGYHKYWPKLAGDSLVCVMLWAFLAHILVHICVIKMIYRMKGRHTRAEQSYAEVAKKEPSTWFSVNPIHCLRSKYIWGHEPAQVYYINGKEHLQRQNVKIGAHFEGKDAQKTVPPVSESKTQRKWKSVPKTAAKAALG